VLAVRLTLTLVVGGHLSYRGVALVLALFAPWCPAGRPCHATARGWLLRLGLWVLRRALPPWPDGWVVLIDHTIRLGAHKCLAIVGLPLAAWRRLGGALTHRDVTLLALETPARSDGAQVYDALRRVQARVGRIAQVVSDRGADLVSGVARLRRDCPEVVATYDVRHLLACLLKAELGPDRRWQAFLRHCSRARVRLAQTAGHFLTPPGWRTKARYMSVAKYVRWARRLLDWERQGTWGKLGDLLGRTAAQARSWFAGVLGWLGGWRSELAEYEGLLAVAEAAQAQVQHGGLSRQTAGQFWLRWRASAGRPSWRVACWARRVRRALQAEGARVPEGQTLLGSSDVIESVFGKYKELVSRSSGAEFGPDVLLLPLLTAPLSAAEIKQGLEAVGAEVRAWAEENLGASAQARKRRLLGAVPAEGVPGLGLGPDPDGPKVA
jgi:hypothetical protein